MDNLFNSFLFPIEEIKEKRLIIEREYGATKQPTYYRKMHCDNLDISLSMKTVGKYGMSPLTAYTGKIPTSVIPFHTALSSKEYNSCVHFYIDDYRFKRIWTNMRQYIPILKRFHCVIGPDFSQFCDMAYPRRLFNCYRNNQISAFWQKHGIKVIPNVTWSLPDSYAFCFDGIPLNSVIAINCTSIVNNNLSKYLWQKGYFEALSRLQPKAIIRYGTVMPFENKEISYYFANERLNELKHGW